VDAPRDGFLTTMEVSCWSFIRMAHLVEPLITRGGTLFTMTYYSSQMAPAHSINGLKTITQSLEAQL
jgi:enoyl-[acyl-carrier-protein] reductase (NADH)